ncbi:MAG: hypothetical protein WA002_15490 [Candidatus Acidiferrales bacterium]
MSKYDKLREWLDHQPDDIVSVSFEDIEDDDRIGVKLPLAARQRRQWWGNEISRDSLHVQCRAWLKAGWKVEELNLATETVVFTRLVGRNGR